MSWLEVENRKDEIYAIIAAVSEDKKTELREQAEHLISLTLNKSGFFDKPFDSDMNISRAAEEKKLVDELISFMDNIRSDLLKDFMNKDVFAVALNLFIMGKMVELVEHKIEISDSRATELLQAEPASIIEALKSVLPQNHVKPVNKFANEITRDFLNRGRQALVVSRANAKQEIVTKATLAYMDENVSLSGRIKFTPYDREVHDGVITLFEAGNNIITPIMVYRAMNGMTDTEYVSPQAIGAVTRSLDKSRRIMVSIDYSQEAKSYETNVRKGNIKTTYEGFLLACDKITVKIAGQNREAYKLLRKPILYEYAQVTKQVITVPTALLRTKEAVRGTEEVIVIRGYLLRQIMGMKSKYFLRSNRITYDGVYAELDMDGLAGKALANKTQKIRGHVSALLEEWTQQKFIKDFSVYKEGNKHRGVIITL